MKKTIILFVALICCIFLTGFAGLSDYSVFFHDDYELARSSAHIISLWYIGDYSDKPYSDHHLIDPKIVEINYSDQYIIAKRHPLVQERENSAYVIPDTSVSLYCIIDMYTFEIYPDMTEEEYLEKRKSLEIPEEMQLLSVEEFRRLHDKEEPFSIWKFFFG